jgi:hypothetical protein
MHKLSAQSKYDYIVYVNYPPDRQFKPDPQDETKEYYKKPNLDKPFGLSMDLLMENKVDYFVKAKGGDKKDGFSRYVYWKKKYLQLKRKTKRKTKTKTKRKISSET